MSNEQKIEYIRGLIQTSPILGDHEKSDWLNLLELMNDKQLGELEEILTPAKTMSVTSGTVSLEAQSRTLISNLPPMTHISNLPSAVVTGQRKPMTSPIPPAVPIKPLAPKPSPLATKPPLAPLTKAPEPSIKLPPAPPIPATPQNEVAPSSGLAPFRVAHNIEDLHSLTINDLRTHDQQSLLLSISNLVNKFGYFAVRNELEASPLYDAYFQTGKQRLSDANLGTPSPLTHEEFELISDMLQAIRVNRT